MQRQLDGIVVFPERADKIEEGVDKDETEGIDLVCRRFPFPGAIGGGKALFRKQGLINDEQDIILDYRRDQGLVSRKDNQFFRPGNQFFGFDAVQRIPACAGYP